MGKVYVIKMLYVNVNWDTLELIVHKPYVKIIVIIMEFVKKESVIVKEDFKDRNVNSLHVLFNVQ